jgi:hypothetical protein
MRWDVDPAEVRDGYVVTKRRDLLEEVMLGEIANALCFSCNITSKKFAELDKFLSPTLINITSTDFNRYQTSPSKGLREEILGILPGAVCESRPLCN